MFKHYILALCITAALIPCSIDAQQAKGAKLNAATTTTTDAQASDDDVYKKLFEVQNQLEDSTKVLQKLRKDLGNLNKKYDQDIIKTKKQVDPLKHELDSLKKINASLTKGQQTLADAKAKEMQKSIDSLNRILTDANRSRDLLVNENSQLNDTIIQLNNELQQLEVFKRDYINNLANVYDRNWASKSFAQIDSTELNNSIADCQRYATQDKRIAKAADNLIELKAQFDIYSNGVRIINSQYNRDDVAKIAAQINQKKPNISSIRKNEIDDLYETLRKYRKATIAFQSLINNIDDETKGYDIHEAAWPMILLALEDPDKPNINLIKTIKKIPWLESQYEIYMQELEKDCKAPSKVHDTILGLKTM